MFETYYVSQLHGLGDNADDDIRDDDDNADGGDDDDADGGDDDDDDGDDDGDDSSGTMCNCMQTNPHQRKGSLTNHSESGSVWFSRVSVLCVVQTTGDYRMIIEDFLNGEIF